VRIEGKDGRILLNPDGTRQDIYAMPMTPVGGYVEVHRVVIAGRPVVIAWGKGKMT
jgi:hypothetical protein